MVEMTDLTGFKEYSTISSSFGLETDIFYTFWEEDDEFSHAVDRIKSMS